MNICIRFGHPSSREYKLKTQKYREKIVNSLHTIAMSFVDSINANLFCFPSSLVWLVNQLYHIVSRSSGGGGGGGGSSWRANAQHDVRSDWLSFLRCSKQMNRCVCVCNIKTARKLCCDVIMALYICPAICDPEPYGVITDMQISTVARHNLMQVMNFMFFFPSFCLLLIVCVWLFD